MIFTFKNLYHIFSLKKKCNIPSLNSQLFQYEHSNRSKIIFLKNKNEHKSFSTIFKITAKNNHGIPSILNKVILYGSKKNKIKNLFSLIKKKLSYVNLESYTQRGYTVYFFSTMNNTDYEIMMDLFLQMIYEPALNKDNFNQQSYMTFKQKRRNGKQRQRGRLYFQQLIKQQQNDYLYQSSILQQIYLNTQYNFSPFGISEQIKLANYQEMLEYYKQYYKEACFFIYGNVNIQSILKKIDKYMKNTTPFIYQKFCNNQDLPVSQQYLTLYYPLKINNPLQHHTFQLLNQILVNKIVQELQDVDQDINLNFNITGYKQSRYPFFGIGINNPSNELKISNNLQQLMEQFLNNFRNNGLSKQMLSSLINLNELKERNYINQTGLYYTQRYSEIMAYGKNIQNYLQSINKFQLLRKQILKNDYVNKVILKLINPKLILTKRQANKQSNQQIFFMEDNINQLNQQQKQQLPLSSLQFSQYKKQYQQKYINQVKCNFVPISEGLTYIKIIWTADQFPLYLRMYLFLIIQYLNSNQQIIAHGSHINYLLYSSQNIQKDVKINFVMEGFTKDQNIKEYFNYFQQVMINNLKNQQVHNQIKKFFNKFNLLQQIQQQNLLQILTNSGRALFSQSNYNLKIIDKVKLFYQLTFILNFCKGISSNSTYFIYLQDFLFHFHSFIQFFFKKSNMSLIIHSHQKNTYQINNQINDFINNLSKQRQFNTLPQIIWNQDYQNPFQQKFVNILYINKYQLSSLKYCSLTLKVPFKYTQESPIIYLAIDIIVQRFLKTLITNNILYYQYEGQCLSIVLVNDDKVTENFDFLFKGIRMFLDGYITDQDLQQSKLRVFRKQDKPIIESFKYFNQLILRYPIEQRNNMMRMIKEIKKEKIQERGKQIFSNILQRKQYTKVAIVKELEQCDFEIIQIFQ